MKKILQRCPYEHERYSQRELANKCGTLFVQRSTARNIFASRTHIQREPQNSLGDLQKESAMLETVKETIIESRMSGER